MLGFDPQQVNEFVWRNSPFLWTLDNRIKNEKGKELEFSNHRFLKDIWDDWTPVQVYRKASQVGFSTMEILKTIVAAKYRDLTTIYCLPTSSDVNQFVSSKTNPIISNNRILTNWIKDKDSITQKQIGNNFIHYRGTFSNKPQAEKMESGVGIMISADILCFDESDRSDQEILQQYESRLDASEYKGKWYFSNPSNPHTLSQKIWEQSDQKHWFIKCEHCRHWQYLDFWKNVKDGKFVCQKCGKEISDEVRRRGQWVKKRNSEISGYWISHLMCVDENSLILLGDGERKKIKDINIGEIIINKNGLLTKVLNIKKSKTDKKIHRIYFGNSGSEQIELTDDHRLYVLELKTDKRHKARDFKKGRFIWKEAKDITDKDYLTCPKPKIKEEKVKLDLYIKKTKIFSGKFDYDLGRFLGLWLAEGSISQQRGCLAIINFSFHIKEKEYIDFVQSVFQKLGIKSWLKINPKVNRISVEAYNKSLANYLLQFGRNAHTKKIPFVFDKNVREGIIRGVFEGDGSKTREHFMLATVSKTLIEQMRFWLMERGLFSVIKEQEITLKSGTKVKSWYISYWGEQAYLLDKILKIQNIPLKNGRGIKLFQDYFLLNVRENKEIRIGGNVCDITVNEGESFIANDIVVHNCSWIPASKIQQEFETKSKQYFYNFVLGLPYIGSDITVNQDVILKAIDLTEPNFRQHNVLGCDSGLKKHYVLGNKQGIFKIGVVDKWEQIEELIKIYDVETAVFDALPDLTEPRKLRDKYVGKIWLNYYKKEVKKADFVSWDEKTHTVYSDRTKLFQDTIDGLVNRKTRFQMQIADLTNYISQWHNVYKRVEKDNLGLERDIWESNGDDHFPHATNYFKLALEKAGGGETKIVDWEQRQRVNTGLAPNVQQMVKDSLKKYD
ncbi:MAG: phage terminase large subunit family protein [Nanoarchaeota archaeon]|nr:phage terminase large subunit family protein [Nanoarchaeota archaeon]